MGRNKKANDVEILRQIALSPDPVVTATELSESLPYAKSGVLNRLRELDEKGYVDSRSVGARSKIWWLTDQGREQLR